VERATRAAMLTLLLVLVLVPAALALTSFIGARQLDAAHPPPGRFVAARGEEIHLVERGPLAKQPIVLIHGASGNHRDLLVPRGARLAGAHPVLAPARPGHGASTRRAGRALASPEEQARVIAAALRAEGVERAVIVGHSFGAVVALALALEAPELVAGL